MRPILRPLCNMYYSSLHPIIIAFAMIKLFVKVSAFAILFVIIERTANVDVPILFTLPPILRAILVAAITWALVLPFYFDVSTFFSTVINVNTQKILLKHGLILKNETSWKRQDVDNIAITQSTIGKKLNFGDVTIITKKKSFTIKNVKQAQQLKDYILKAD